VPRGERTRFARDWVNDHPNGKISCTIFCQQHFVFLALGATWYFYVLSAEDAGRVETRIGAVETNQFTDSDQRRYISSMFLQRFVTPTAVSIKRRELAEVYQCKAEMTRKLSKIPVMRAGINVRKQVLRKVYYDGQGVRPKIFRRPRMVLKSAERVGLRTIYAWSNVELGHATPTDMVKAVDDAGRQPMM